MSLKKQITKLGADSLLPDWKPPQGVRKISAAEYRGMAKKPKRSKYHVAAKKDRTLDGIVFDSKGEAKRWAELKLLERVHEIVGLTRQVPFVLHVRGRQLGKYIADFYYIEPADKFSSRRVVEDFKGLMTPLARWKIKHFEAQYGIKVRITGAAKR